MSGDDRRVQLSEFQKGCEKLGQKMTAVILKYILPPYSLSCIQEVAAAEFAAIDVNGGGQVSYYSVASGLHPFFSRARALHLQLVIFFLNSILRQILFDEFCAFVAKRAIPVDGQVESEFSSKIFCRCLKTIIVYLSISHVIVTWVSLLLSSSISSIFVIII